eukprot:6737726-Prymnesium_polylepis.1
MTGTEAAAEKEEAWLWPVAAAAVGEEVVVVKLEVTGSVAAMTGTEAAAVKEEAWLGPVAAAAVGEEV